MRILPLEVKIFVNIQLDVIWADIRRLGHIYSTLIVMTNVLALIYPLKNYNYSICAVLIMI